MLVSSRQVLLAVLCILHTSAQVEVYLTTSDKVNLYERQQDVPMGPALASSALVVNVSTEHQRMVGYGAAITDSAAWNLYNSSVYEPLMEELFGESGMRLSLVRIAMGVSDFSLSYAVGNQTYDDVPGDWGLAHFSTAHDDAYILPVLRKARELNPELKIIATPWTAPLWLKTSGTNGRLGEGTLINSTQAYSTYGEYFARFAEDYLRKGVRVDYFTLQNEPGHSYGCGDMPCMYMSESQEARLAPLVGRALQSKGLGSTKILGYDHNWAFSFGGVPGGPQYPDALFRDPVAGPYFAGVAWHCYGGDVTAQAVVHRRFPQKEVHMTECSSVAGTGTWWAHIVQNMREVFVGGAKNWGQSVVLWNMALDEKGGPHCSGEACCKNCRGVVTVPTDATSPGQVTRNVEYYSLAHFSRLVSPGSRRVELVNVIAQDVDATAFVTPSGRAVLVALNPTGANVSFSVTTNVSLSGGEAAARSFEYSLPPGVATFAWDIQGVEKSDGIFAWMPSWMTSAPFLATFALIATAAAAGCFGKDEPAKRSAEACAAEERYQPLTDASPRGGRREEACAEEERYQHFTA